MFRLVSHSSETMYKLEQLAERAGVSARTVRYYVQRGLLPAPAFRGRDTVYSPEHLVRLRAIKRLQERHLPLDAIQVEIERRSLEQLRDLADGRDAIPHVRGGETPEGDGTYVVIPRTVHPHPHPTGYPYRDPVTVPMRPARWDRWEILPGLEIHVSDEAGAEARALADELRALAERRARHGGTSR